MKDLLILYLICDIFVIVSFSCLFLKLKKILMEKPGLINIFKNINDVPKFYNLIFLLCPIIHLIPLYMCVSLSLISDEKLIKIMEDKFKERESLELKKKFKENIEIIMLDDNNEDKIKNEILSYLKIFDITTEDLDNNVEKIFLGIINGYIFSDNTKKAKKNISEKIHIIAILNKKEMEFKDIFQDLLKVKEEKEIFEKTKDMLLNIFK